MKDATKALAQIMETDLEGLILYSETITIYRKLANQTGDSSYNDIANEYQKLMERLKTNIIVRYTKALEY